jgi:hypothetical protein
MGSSEPPSLPLILAASSTANQLAANCSSAKQRPKCVIRPQVQADQGEFGDKGCAAQHCEEPYHSDTIKCACISCDSQCKGTSVHSLTSPCLSLCLYVFPTVSIHIRPQLYHCNLLAIIDAPYQYLNSQWFGQLDRNQGWYLATTIAHIGVMSHDPMVPSYGRRTSIFGRLGTRRLGTVISTISYVAWPSQESLERSLRISLG